MTTSTITTIGPTISSYTKHKKMNKKITHQGRGSHQNEHFLLFHDENSRGNRADTIQSAIQAAST
eukprot:CAMPEP_0202473140 /NCGR_PEP_ID=MMETSP1360-20130828/90022_1 /ASSEMBLY_ACC=CAM_ASM_000848 /TAXON_ID=515479 /ORGANISM="Licmophora paradoxa, Strain CCMP2313" /LENGTH=64 /DNA_ID=CAMNT_0049099919 /DNA_START=13 /DNA_END=203 /DNA_ORIENTATION=-